MMPLHLRSLFLLISLLFPLSICQHYGSLWCHQGSKTFSPTQCEPSTLDCFKFVCDHIDAGFVARGCGVSVSRTASGLPNESCHQALAQCQQIGGNGTCSLCNNIHMCNTSSPTTFLVPFAFFFISILRLIF